MYEELLVLLIKMESSQHMHYLFLLQETINSCFKFRSCTFCVNFKCKKKARACHPGDLHQTLTPMKDGIKDRERERERESKREEEAGCKQ